MSILAYRDARPEDAAELAELARDTFTATFGHLYAAEDLAAFLSRHSPGAWRRRLAGETSRTRLALQDGTAIGYIRMGPLTLPVTPSGPAAELRALYVRKAWHGRGAASALMDWGIAVARQWGAAALYLSVYVDNHRARRFYERYGFTYVGPYAFMVGSHADEDHILRLDLGGADER